MKTPALTAPDGRGSEALALLFLKFIYEAQCGAFPDFSDARLVVGLLHGHAVERA